MTAPPEPRPIVLKFGSSILRSELDLPRAVEEIRRFRDAGRPVLSVVSAIGATTDTLLAQAHRISRNPDPSALALMVATGEDVAASFLTMALEDAGVRAALMEPVGIGLRVEGPPLDSEPTGLDCELVRRAIRSGAVGVVPGFYGRGPEGRIHLLGRGGSDLTALHIAHSLGADCRLLKNVDGVYEDDPAGARGPARRYASLSYADALALEGRVVMRKALRFAESHGIVFHVAALDSPSGTRVGAPTEWDSPPTEWGQP